MITAARRGVGVMAVIACVLSFVLLATGGDMLYFVTMIGSGIVAQWVHPGRPNRKRNKRG